jgi:hypothetical protein
MSDLTSAIVGAMLTLAPPSGIVEPVEDALQRYHAIARDIVAIAEEEPVAPGADVQTAAFLVSIGYHESGYALDVDTGHRRGDRQSSCTIWQVNRGRSACVSLLANRRAAAREAAIAVRRSFGACRRARRAHWLAAYASGSCKRGLLASEARMRTADRVMGMLQ